MTVRAPYQPRYGSGQTVTTGAASASISLDPAAKSVRIVNTAATNGAYIRIGKGAQTCTAADLYIGTSVNISGTIVLQKAEGDDTLAYLQLTGATTLNVTTGEGGQ